MNSKIYKNRKIGLIVNTSKHRTAEVAMALCSWLKDKNITPLMADEYAEFVGMPSMGYDNEQVIDNSDILIVLGGDGTMLATAHIPNADQVPILGVNLGSFGFLTEVAMDEIYPAVSDVLSGNYEIDKRIMLKCEVMLNDKKIGEYLALNEVFLCRLTHLIRLDTHIDDNYFLTYNGDGVIVATPSGSTAYSLSVGGPIVEPDMDAILLSPIASHALTVRPFLAHPESQISVRLSEDCSYNATLSVDGRKVLKLNPDHTVKISKAEKTIKLICSPERSYYDILRNKLQWGARA